MTEFLEKVYDRSPIFFQNLMTTVSGYQRNLTRYGETYYNYLKFLDEYDLWSLDQKLEHQRNELIAFINYAAEKSTFYKKLYFGIDLSSIQSVDDLKHLPVVDKEMLRQNLRDVVTIPHKNAVEWHTGGTTGKN